MNLRTAFSVFLLAVLAWAALPAQAQCRYYRRPAPRRVVLVRPAPVLLAPVVPVVAAYPPAYLGPAPVVLVRPRPVLYRPRPVVVRRGRRW